jgi:putative spermidine/putrescine transport system permease protein
MSASMPARSPLQALSNALYLHPRLLLALLLAPPLLWLGVVYLGSLLTLLLQSFFYVDEFSGKVVREFSLRTWGELVSLANLDVVVRTTVMAAVVTVFSLVLAFPLAYFMVRHAGLRWKAFLYLAVMLPLWSSYLVRVYSWKLILAKEGIVTWVSGKLGLAWLLEAVLSLPSIGGPSLSTSWIGTCIVFVYIWLPFMVLPMVAALERVPKTLIEAAADLGARPRQTFTTVIWPLALPGVAAGSIFTFSLTLGDYIIPQIIGGSQPFIGQAVYLHQGTAGNVPMAAAMTIVPIAIMGVYLTVARKMGAFDAL